MDGTTRATLGRIAGEQGTPSYVYFLEPIRARCDRVREAFGGRFDISYAVKCNPNQAVLRAIRDKVVALDTSSIGEVERAQRAGYPPSDLSFSGPAKRRGELKRSVSLGVGQMVCESLRELEELDELAGKAGRTMSVLVRLNPRRVPSHFGVSMAGRPSQFGVDEEEADQLLARRRQWRNLDLAGFHIYSATNSLNAAAIIDNFGIFVELFQYLAEGHALSPRTLVFGSGFGIPYHDGDAELSLDELAWKINPMIDAMRERPLLSAARCVLEMGRYLVGPHGFLLTSVVSEKDSRGTKIRMCDAGFNNHLAACGMMGSLIRRNWPIWKVSGGSDEPAGEYTLVGPLCTTIDQIATHIRLPDLRRGDVLAIGSSGAYGLTASPTRFISHPEPAELAVLASGEVQDVSEAEPWRAAPEVQGRAWRRSSSSHTP